jgi:hypothetical protein
MNALATAVTTTSFVPAPDFTVQLHPVTEATLLGAETAFSRGFARALRRMREKVTPSTAIDIRGCLAGSSNVYLEAVATFFGGPDNLPQVSGPDRFTSFPVPAAHLISGEDVPGFSNRADVQSAVDHWADLVGVRFVPGTAPDRKLRAYLDSNFALPVLNPHDSATNTEPLPEIICLASSEAAKRDWLLHQWHPPLGSAAERLRKRWKPGSMSGPPMIELTRSLLPSPTQERAVAPDLVFANHIKKLN